MKAQQFTGNSPCSNPPVDLEDDDRGGPMPSIDAADAVLDERRELAELGNQINPVRV
jgi:hypothetical protein